MSAARTSSPPLAPPVAWLWIALVGGGAVAAGSVVIQPAEGWSGVLTAAVFGASLALGGVVLLAINSASGARWWRPLRPLSLVLGRALAAPAAVLGLCFAFGLEALYPWAREGTSALTTTSSKALWLSTPLFRARALVILVVWLGFLAAFGQRLEALRLGPSRAGERALARISVLFLVILGITLSVAGWDWTMSLEPQWYSTIYAVYLFAGSVASGIAAFTLVCLIAERTSALKTPVTAAQRHDLGKLLFAFSAFWAYIWFCQFLLIWYVNLPEEVGHYLRRQTGGWLTLFYLNPILNFVAPFVVLLAAPTKRHVPTLLQVCLVVLAGRWLDTYLLVAPALGHASSFPAAAVGATLAVVAGMGLLVQRDLRAAPSATVQADTELLGRAPV